MHAVSVCIWRGISGLRVRGVSGPGLRKGGIVKGVDVANAGSPLQSLVYGTRYYNTYSNHQGHFTVRAKGFGDQSTICRSWAVRSNRMLSQGQEIVGFLWKFLVQEFGDWNVDFGL